MSRQCELGPILPKVKNGPIKDRGPCTKHVMFMKISRKKWKLIMTMLQRHSKSRSMRCEIPIGPQPIPKKKKDEHEQSSMRHKTTTTHVLFLDLRLIYTIAS